MNPHPGTPALVEAVKALAECKHPDAESFDDEDGDADRIEICNKCGASRLHDANDGWTLWETPPLAAACIASLPAAPAVVVRGRE